MMPRSPSRLFLAAYFSLAAAVGCGASVTGGTTGMGGVSGTSGGGAAGGTGGTGGAGGMAGGSGVSCHQCACEDPMSMGGCADFCTTGLNGPSGTNFCNGFPAWSHCADCLMKNCPSADPDYPSTCM